MEAPSSARETCTGTSAAETIETAKASVRIRFFIIMSPTSIYPRERILFPAKSFPNRPSLLARRRLRGGVAAIHDRVAKFLAALFFTLGNWINLLGNDTN